MKEALDRFWETSVKPDFPDRSNSILSDEMLVAVVHGLPETEDDWFRVVPMNVRQAMDPMQRVFLPDILDVVAEYV